MSEVKSAAQLRAEKRKQRILQGSSSRIQQITGDQRQAPSLEFPVNREIPEAEYTEKINQILSGSGKLTEPRLKNPYFQQQPPLQQTNQQIPKPTPQVSKIFQFAAVLFLTISCFLFQIHYGMALIMAILAFVSLQMLNIRTFISIPPLINMIPGMFRNLAKAAFFIYRYDISKRILRPAFLLSVITVTSEMIVTNQSTRLST